VLDDRSAPPTPAFHTTRWSMVLRARADEPEVARAALDELVRDYWFPLYGYLRSGGRGDEDAREATQAFIADLLERGGGLGGADPDRGRFRAYLIGALRNHMRNAVRAERRGGGAVRALGDVDPEGAAATRYDLSARGDDAGPAAWFERAWALEVLGRATERLEAEWRARGRGEAFDALRDTLDGGDGGASHAERAARLGCTEGAVRVAAHRLRARLGELLREEVARTVEGADDVEAELRDLAAALSRSGPAQNPADPR